VHTDGQTV